MGLDAVLTAVYATMGVVLTVAGLYVLVHEWRGYRRPLKLLSRWVISSLAVLLGLASLLPFLPAALMEPATFVIQALYAVATVSLITFAWHVRSES